MFKRKDGIKVKNLTSMNKIMPHLMDKRTDAEVYLKETFEITDLLNYLDKKNTGLKKEERYTLFIAIITTVFKIMKNRPYLNRFISGRTLYDRIELSAGFVIKKVFEDTSEEALYIYRAKNTDYIDTIRETIKKEVHNIRSEKVTSIDKIIDAITSGPRFLTMFIVKILKTLDFYGLVPSSITKDDPNHTSVFLTNLGSIKCNQVYHHLNNYGTNSFFISVGTIYEIDGKKYVDMGFTIDERIADGFYFAKSILLAKEILKNPKTLEDRIDTKLNE
jgi:hypothetical protein